jgi:glycosyltransferase involved in cell wall biosynthesis
VERIEQLFASQKVTINFLHMHSREVFYYDKVEFLRSTLPTDLLRTNEKAKTSFMQALANFQLPHANIHIENEIKDWQRKEHDRLSGEYDFGLAELPFCIVVPTLNNAKGFRYQYNLQSMVNLDYKNFKVVIVDDASTDHTYELIRQWIEENRITLNIVVLTNEKRRTAVPNIHRAVTDHCGSEDIVVLVDGDDELLGRYSLKVFNHLYQKSGAGVVYSNHLQFYTHIKQVYRGWSMNYSDEEKKNNRYRDVPQRIAHLRSFKASLYRQIKEEDLKDEKGEWLTSTYDEVICLPILELSCGRIVYVEEFFYLYNFGIGTNDLQVDPGLQKNIADYVKYKKPKYQCLNP